jgi:hypothetical protein
LLPYPNAVVQHYKAGFQSGKSTTDQLFALRQILEKGNEYNIRTQHLFIDFKAAYDFNFHTKLIRQQYQVLGWIGQISNCTVISTVLAEIPPKKAKLLLFWAKFSLFGGISTIFLGEYSTVWIRPKWSKFLITDYNREHF